jgi:nucleotide-binding universal stress UspA family protein
MAGRIVVGVDDSEGSRQALKWAVDEARRRHGTEVHAVHVWHPPYVATGPFVPTPWVTVAAAERSAEYVLDQSVDGVDDRGLPRSIQRILVRDSAAHGLLAAAEGADLVVVGSRGRGGFAGLLLGSVSRQVLHHATVPAVVVPAWTNHATNLIVVGVDDSPGARTALAWAVTEARATGARLRVVHAYEVDIAWIEGDNPDIPRWQELARERAEDLLDAMASEVIELSERDQVDLSAIRGTAAEVLDHQAAEADLLVVGSRGRGGFARLLLGSVSQRVAERASCPVVIVPGERAAETHGNDDERVSAVYVP